MKSAIAATVLLLAGCVAAPAAPASVAALPSAAPAAVVAVPPCRLHLYHPGARWVTRPVLSTQPLSTVRLAWPKGVATWDFGGLRLARGVYTVTFDDGEIETFGDGGPTSSMECA